MNQLLSRLCGLASSIQQLPEGFLDTYPKFQFEVGWRLRNKIAGREYGPIADHQMHPDAATEFDKLDPGVKSFVEWMSVFHLMLFAALGKSEIHEQPVLVALRECGVAEDLNVPEELMAKVNTAHHQAWLAARATYCFLGFGSVRDHKTAKEKSHLLPEEIKADNAQVCAYAKILASMAPSDFAQILDLSKSL